MVWRAEHRRAYPRKTRTAEYFATRRAQHRARGLCSDCPRPSGDRWRCFHCAVLAALRLQRLRERRKESKRNTSSELVHTQS